MASRGEGTSTRLKGVKEVCPPGTMAEDAITIASRSLKVLVVGDSCEFRSHDLAPLSAGLALSCVSPNPLNVATLLAPSQLSASRALSIGFALAKCSSLPPLQSV